MNSTTTKLGLCVLCGSRVHKAENHLKTKEGYCHRYCITDRTAVTA